MSELPLEVYQEAHNAFGDDVMEVFDWLASTDARDTDGGTSLRSVREQLERVQFQLEELGLASNV